MHYYGSYTPWQAHLQGGSAGTPTGGACSLFAAMGDPGSGHHGRNFDWEFSPALFLHSNPGDGYASVSMVGIAYLGFVEDTAKVVASLPMSKLQFLLLAPWLPAEAFGALPRQDPGGREYSASAARLLPISAPLPARTNRSSLKPSLQPRSSSALRPCGGQPPG